eukprot:GHVU01207928.1.p1 GENE.GHVU01207928.1~~GHVU01207928.1.p1  ORF type:complete len:145 (-),score=18.74 GHVU01207928.1:699-1133(-)
MAHRGGSCVYIYYLCVCSPQGGEGGRSSTGGVSIFCSLPVFSLLYIVIIVAALSSEGWTATSPFSRVDNGRRKRRPETMEGCEPIIPDLFLSCCLPSCAKYFCIVIIVVIIIVLIVLIVLIIIAIVMRRASLVKKSALLIGSLE